MNTSIVHISVPSEGDETPCLNSQHWNIEMVEQYGMQILSIFTSDQTDRFLRHYIKNRAPLADPELNT